MKFFIRIRLHALFQIFLLSSYSNPNKYVHCVGLLVIYFFLKTIVVSVYKFIFNKISLFLIIKQYSILSIFNQSYRHCSHINSADIFFHLPLKTIKLSKNNESVCCLCHRPSWHKITPPLFFYFLFTYLLSIKFLYYFISFSLF